MKIYVNGSPLDVPDGATVSDVLTGQRHVPGSHIALIRSMEEQKRETEEFEITTNRGSFVVHVPEGPWSKAWRELSAGLVDRTVRWQTSKVTAIGAFPSNITPSREPSKFTKYDCFFALGGYDNRTTYIMIARQDHEASYGVAVPIFGRITRGRHVIDHLQETDKVLSITPVIIHFRTKDAFATDDLSTKLEPGMSVETYVGVKLDPRSPVSVEHLLVAVEDGTLRITDKTESFTASSVRMDVSLVEETHGIREEDLVTVRHTGPGMGRIYFYQTRRQTTASHNVIGRIVNGHQLVHLVPEGAYVTIVPDPARVMVIGMTQKEGQAFLEGRGLKQNRTGDAADNAIIVEQEPELTVHAVEDKEIDTFGVPSSKITVWYMYRDRSPNSVRYIEKMTGLDYKPIGTLKVHFTFEGMPMVTFEGDEQLGARLFPEPTFDGVVHRCDVGLTNMSRPHHGLIGIRLEDSNEFGPTGEEPHGTNMIGRFVGDLDAMMKGLKNEAIVYIRETAEDPDKAKKKVPRAEKAAKPEKATKPKTKAKTTKKKKEAEE